jgi:hypothetical protein
MGILNLRKKSVLDRFGEEYDPADLDPGETYIAPVKPSLDTPALSRLATSDVKETGNPTSDWKRMMDLVNQAYTPATEARDRFKGLLESFPQREEPDWKRKLVAGGIGLDARQRVGTPGQEFTARGNPLEAMEAAMYAPYLRDLGEWKEKAEPFSKAAQLENTANVNERALAGNLLTAHTQTEKLAETERHNRRREESERTRALAYDFYQRTRGVKWDLSGTTIKVMDAQGNIRDTGLSTDKLSEEARISMQNQGRIDAAAQGNRIPVMIDNKPYILDPNSNMLVPLTIGETQPSGAVTPIGTQPPRAGAAEKPLTRDQRVEQEFQRAREMADEFRDYIDLNEEDSTYEIGVPGIDMFAGQGTKDKAKEIERYIQGLGPKPSRGAPSGNIPSTAPPTQKPAPAPAPAPVQSPVAPVPQTPRMLPSSSAYGPGARIPDRPATPFMGPKQLPPPIVNPPSSSVYGPGGTPRPNRPTIPQGQNIPTIPQAQIPPGHIIVQKDGQTFALPAEQRDEAIRQGYAVVR